MDAFDRVRRRSPYADPREYKNVQECNEYMLESTAHADVTFLVGPDNGEQAAYKAHSYVLFCRSPVFGKMFTSQLENSKVVGTGKLFKPTKKTVPKGMKDLKGKGLANAGKGNVYKTKGKTFEGLGIKLKATPQKAPAPKLPPPPRGSNTNKPTVDVKDSPSQASVASLEEVIKEFTIQDDGVIRVKDITPASFKGMLMYLYSEEVDLTTDTVMGITAAAHKFRVYSLTERCQEFMKTSVTITERNVLPLLAQAVPNNAEGLVDDCLDFVDDNPDIYDTEEFQNLPKPVLDAVYVGMQ